MIGLSIRHCVFFVHYFFEAMKLFFKSYLVLLQFWMIEVQPICCKKCIIYFFHIDCKLFYDQISWNFQRNKLFPYFVIITILVLRLHTKMMWKHIEYPFWFEISHVFSKKSSSLSKKNCAEKKMIINKTDAHTPIVLRDYSKLYILLVSRLITMKKNIILSNRQCHWLNDLWWVYQVFTLHSIHW